MLKVEKCSSCNFFYLIVYFIQFWQVYSWQWFSINGVLKKTRNKQCTPLFTFFFNQILIGKEHFSYNLTGVKTINSVASKGILKKIKLNLVVIDHTTFMKSCEL